MECPPPPGAPTLSDELRRGVNPYNLGFGGVAALVLGLAVGGLSGAGVVPLLVGPAWLQGLVTAAALFVLLTVLHTLAHGMMGWAFERGLALHCQGRHAAALRWLALADKPGMDHYDPHGVALAALREAREIAALTARQQEKRIR